MHLFRGVVHTLQQHPLPFIHASFKLQNLACIHSNIYTEMLAPALQQKHPPPPTQTSLPSSMMEILGRSISYKKSTLFAIQNAKSKTVTLREFLRPWFWWVPPPSFFRFCLLLLSFFAGGQKTSLISVLKCLLNLSSEDRSINQKKNTLVSV